MERTILAIIFIPEDALKKLCFGKHTGRAHTQSVAWENDSTRINRKPQQRLCSESEWLDEDAFEKTTIHIGGRRRETRGPLPNLKKSVREGFGSAASCYNPTDKPRKTLCTHARGRWSTQLIDRTGVSSGG